MVSPALRDLECFYCGAPVSEPWEYQRDHFPVPDSCGGRETVIACCRCHHMKDRASVERLLADVLPLIHHAPADVVQVHRELLDLADGGLSPAAYYAAIVARWEDLEPPFRWLHSRKLALLYRAESASR